MKGNIKRFIVDKNYGFIEVEGEEKDLFFHVNSVAEGYNPSEGDAVEFEKEESDKGPNAVNVRKAGASAASESQAEEEEETEEETEE